ncbi:MAG: T9SS type A sorting domain-containing protein, partial [Bacteroidota bacterium]
NNADDYVVRHRKVDEMDWIENTTSTDSINLDKLDSCSSYEFQVKANCLGNSSQYSSSFNFNTSCITSVDDPAAFAKLMVFPNPFIDRFNIRYSLGTGTTVSISLLDLQGRTIKQLSPGYLPQGEYEEQIVWPQLAAGVYLLRIATEQGVAVRKVVRQQF